MAARTFLINLCALLLFSVHASCQSKKNTSTMERFNIVAFEAKAQDDEYTQQLQDGTKVVQMRYEYGFTEKTIPTSGWFDYYKEYNNDGILRMKGQLIKKSSTRYGKWTEYSDDGHESHDTDYNAPYKLDVSQVAAIVKQQNIPFNMDQPGSRIIRNIIQGKATWIVEWKVRHDRIEKVYIDDASARIVRQGFTPFADNE